MSVCRFNHLVRGFATVSGKVDLGVAQRCNTDVVQRGSANNVYKVFLLRVSVGQGLWGYGQKRAPPSFLIKVLRVATLSRASPRYPQEEKL